MIYFRLIANKVIRFSPEASPEDLEKFLGYNVMQLRKACLYMK